MFARLFRAAVFGRDVGFVTDDRIDPGLLRLAVELQRSVQVAVIGQRQRIHAMVFARSISRSMRRGSVQQAVVAVAMQVDKRLRHPGFIREGGGLVLALRR